MARGTLAMSSKKKLGHYSKRYLPNTDSWQPRHAPQTLGTVGLDQCQQAEERLLLAIKHAHKSNIEAFSSGFAFEESARKEIRLLLPSRYEISSGHVIDNHGRTAGQCDIVLFNGYWFQPLKSSLSGGAGDIFFPVEGVYAIGEVKQTLSHRTLEDAVKKLVICNRLQRHRTSVNRISENRDGKECLHGLSNPLYTFILAGRIEKGTNIESLLEYFIDLNSSLKRLEVVRSMCVLGEGSMVWSFCDPEKDGEIRPALFRRDDLFNSIIPTYMPASLNNPLHSLIQNINLSLYHCILGPEDISALYSGKKFDVKLPKDLRVSLPPDKDWLDMLDFPCGDHE